MPVRPPHSSPLENMYTALTTLFAVILITGNLTYQKFVSVGALPWPLPARTLEVSVGLLFYPFTFLITDLITEFYGQARATFCVRLAIALNTAVALAIAGMDQLEATPWSLVNNDIFHQVFGHYSLALIASLGACYAAQAVDIQLYLWIRRWTGEGWLWVRSSFSTGLSLLIDTTIVLGLLTFFEIIPSSQFTSLLLNSYLFKLGFTIFSIPLFYGSVRLLRWILPKFPGDAIDK